MDSSAGVNASKINPQRVRRSSSYRTALARATQVLKKPDRLAQLIKDASTKADKLDKGPIADAKDSLLTLFRLVKAYARGDYRNISWSNLVLVVSAIIYFVTPIDLVPDFILALGYLDDAAILAWTIKALGEEVREFSRWEANHPAVTPEAVEMAED